MCNLIKFSSFKLWMVFLISAVLLTSNFFLFIFFANIMDFTVNVLVHL